MPSPDFPHSAQPRESASDADAKGSTRGLYPYYVLFVLGLVNLFNFIDRHILGVLFQPIQQEFGVSDEAMGILGGFAFVLVHSLFGIPLARLADRTTRSRVIAAGVAVWSGMTALMGMATSFWHLVVLRIGVGIGEAAGAPPSHSLISDYFAPERRATALSIYNMGIYAGIMFGYFAAGWISENFGWRWTFVGVGLPGLGIALLVATTVKEPPRAPALEGETLADVLRFLMTQRAYLALLVAASFHALAGYSAVAWTPAFFSRVFELSQTEIGLWLGLVSGLGGAAGALTGGMLADRLGRTDARWYGWVAAVSALAAVPLTAAYLLADTAAASLFGYLAFIFVIGAYNGPMHAMTQALARPRMRATAVAVHLLVVTILGGGTGPWIVGRVSDTLRPEYGEDGLRYAMLFALAISAAIAGAFYLLASRFLRADFERASRTEEGLHETGSLSSS